MENLNEQFEEDASVVPQITDLDKLQQLVQEHLFLEKTILELSEKLVSLQFGLKKIDEEQIPSLFEALHLQEFRLDSGYKITVKPFYAASISDDNKEKAFEWLKEQGLDDVIKNEVKSMFGKGEDQEAENLMKLLAEQSINFTNKKAVHPQTLKALVKEQIESESDRLAEGYHFPRDLFGVFIGKKTKVELPKERRK